MLARTQLRLRTNRRETLLPAGSTSHLNEIARNKTKRSEGKPLWICEWVDVLFVHCECEACELQRTVPFGLDLFHGRAYVSLVSFMMRRFRPAFGGRLAEVLFLPFSTTLFLNVRTYVLHEGEPGIFFIAEFISNRFVVPFGPPLYGLPYRFARLTNVVGANGGLMTRKIEMGGHRLRIEAHMREGKPAQKCEEGSLTKWLLERYTAFTVHRGKRRCFHIRHQPWLQCNVDSKVSDEGLLAPFSACFGSNSFVKANYSVGAEDVRMGMAKGL